MTIKYIFITTYGIVSLIGTVSFYAPQEPLCREASFGSCYEMEGLDTTAFAAILQR